MSSLPVTSRASASLTRMPFWAPFPVATMIEVGVASPSAQGHAMRSTATVLSSAKRKAGSGPHTNQPTNVNTAATMTAGTK